MLLSGVKWSAGKIGGFEEADAEEFEPEAREGVEVVVVGGRGWDGEGVRAEGGGRGIESGPKGGRLGLRTV